MAWFVGHHSRTASQHGPCEPDAHPVVPGTGVAIRRLLYAVLLGVVYVSICVHPTLISLAQYVAIPGQLGQHGVSQRPTYQAQASLADSSNSTAAAVRTSLNGSGACPLGYRILTISTGLENSRTNLCRLVESALRQGIDPKVIGWNRTWVGLMNKPQWLLEELSTYPPDCLVAFVDSDVMFQQNMEYILQTYEQAVGSARVLMGAECACWPFMVWRDLDVCLHRYPPSPTKYRYGNSGFVMGRVAELLRFYEETMARANHVVDNRIDDQGPSAILYVERGEELGITLDYYSRIAHQMYEASNYTHGHHEFTWVGEIEPFNNEPPQSCAARTFHLKFIEGQYRNVYTHTTPAILHFNGDTKHVAPGYVKEYRRARAAELGRDEFQAEVFTIGNETVLLSSGERVGLFDLCPNYDLWAGTEGLW